MGLFNFKKPTPQQPTINMVAKAPLECGISTPYNVEYVVQQILNATQPAPSIIPSFALGSIAKLEVIKLIDGTSRAKHAHMLKIDTGGNIIDAYVDSNGNVLKAELHSWPVGDNTKGFKVLLDTYRSDSLYIKEVAAVFNK